MREPPGWWAVKARVGPNGRFTNRPYAPTLAITLLPEGAPELAQEDFVGGADALRVVFEARALEPLHRLPVLGDLLGQGQPELGQAAMAFPVGAEGAAEAVAGLREEKAIGRWGRGQGRIGLARLDPEQAELDLPIGGQLGILLEARPLEPLHRQAILIEGRGDRQPVDRQSAILRPVGGEGSVDIEL